MNKICIVNYGADEKNKFTVSDYGDIRVISCNFKKSKPGFLIKRRIRKHSDGYPCFDKYCICENIIYPDAKALYKRDIGYCVKKYCEFYGIDCKNKEIAVYGKVEPDAIKCFSENFSMVWLFGMGAGEYYNTFEVRNKKYIKTHFSVFADESFDIPESELVFNLTDANFPSICNIDICAYGISGIPSLYRNEAVRLMGMDYDIISFIK